MYGYYILEDLNPALLERQRLRNEARAAAFYAAIRPLREGTAQAVAALASGLWDAIDFLRPRIRTSLLSVGHALSIYRLSRH